MQGTFLNQQLGLWPRRRNPSPCAAGELLHRGIKRNDHRNARPLS